MTTDVTPAAGREAATAAGTEPTRSGPVFVPATDIYETANGLVLFAEIPGTDPGSISVTLDRQVLRLSARTQMAAPAGYSLIHAEYRHGDFERAFTLPLEVDAERIEATVKDGLLKVVLPKAAPAPARTISVKVA